MADLGVDIRGVPENPEGELEELELVIVNTQSRDGTQMSFLLEGDLSMTHQMDGDTLLEVHTFQVVRRVVPGEDD